MKTSRGSFVRGSFGVCIAGVLTAACGGDDEEGTPAGGGCTANISENHGHSIVVSAADKMAAAAKTYDIKGSSAHSHTVMIAAEDWADLGPGDVFVITSSEDAGHTHDVTITC